MRAWAIVAALLVLGLSAVVLLRSNGTSKPSPTPPGAARVVALSPALAVIARDLGFAPLIVGRHGYDMVLDRAMPVCGDQAGIDYEALLRVRPTLVLTEWSGELPPRLLTLGKQHGWRIQNFNLLTLDDIADATVWLAGTLGTGLPDSPASALSRRMDAAWSLHPGLERAGRVLLLESLDPPAALGPGSCHHQVLVRIGGTPAIVTGAPYVTLDAEDLLRLAPDAIVWINPRDPAAPHAADALDPAALRRRLGRIGDLDLPAFRTGRVALIDDPLSLTPSTAMIAFAEHLAAILERWSD
ncbi:MAG: ABC transporter substrate-binding protein [Phycisphaerales bacterium]